jgi:carboxypeptidase C (cathepsin A)
VTAAPFVWKFLQAFYAQFPAYKNRNFGLFTESYGGHYGPEFASYLWVLCRHYLYSSDLTVI